MSLTLQADPLPLRVEEDGGIRVGQSRIHLELVIEWFEAGQSPEAIVEGHDTLCLADLYAVIAHYLKHKDEVKAYVARRDREAEELRMQLEAEGISRPGFYQELLARRARMRNGDAPAADRRER
jgi:uncharacterized protein (DUF433 family)